MDFDIWVTRGPSTAFPLGLLWLCCSSVVYVCFNSIVYQTWKSVISTTLMSRNVWTFGRTAVLFLSVQQFSEKHVFLNCFFRNGLVSFVKYFFADFRLGLLLFEKCPWLDGPASQNPWQLPWQLAGAVSCVQGRLLRKSILAVLTTLSCFFHTLDCTSS